MGSRSPPCPALAAAQQRVRSLRSPRWRRPRPPAERGWVAAGKLEGRAPLGAPAAPETGAEGPSPPAPGPGEAGRCGLCCRTVIAPFSRSVWRGAATESGFSTANPAGTRGAERRAVVPPPPTYTPTRWETALAVSGDLRFPEMETPRDADAQGVGLESRGTKSMTLCSAGFPSRRQGWRSYPAHPVYYWPNAEAWEGEGQRQRVGTVREEGRLETQETVPSANVPAPKKPFSPNFPVNSSTSNNHVLSHGSYCP